MAESITLSVSKTNNTVTLSWTIDGFAVGSEPTNYSVYRSQTPYLLESELIAEEVVPLTYQDNPPTDVLFNWYYRVTATIGSSIFYSNIITYLNNSAFVVPQIVGPFNSQMPDESLMKYYFDEVRSRNLWILQNDGEPMKVLQMRKTGTRCPHIDDLDGSESCPFPLGEEADHSDACYGTTFLGGYYPAFAILARRWNTNKNEQIKDHGWALDQKPVIWTVWDPDLMVGDIFVDSQNKRWQITDKHTYHWRGLVTHNEYNVALLEPTHMVYNIEI